MRGWLSLAPVAALAVTGCMASKADIVLLQDEIRTLRAMQSRADSVRKMQADSTRAATLMAIAKTQDSVRSLSQRFGAFQATINGELFEMGKQLITIQELAGMSSKRIMDLRSTMEDRAQAMTGGDTTTRAASEPGPAQLYQAAYDLARRGSHSAARQGYEELLRRFPDFDEAPATLMFIGQTYADERPPRTAEADSVYLLVVKTYPRSKDAATSLFKYAMSLERQKKIPAARQALQRVITEYRGTPEAELAADRLKTLK